MQARQRGLESRARLLADLGGGEVGQVRLVGALDGVRLGPSGQCGRPGPQAPDEDRVEVPRGRQLHGAAVPGVPELHVQHGQCPLQPQVLIGSHGVVDVLGLALADVVGLQDALHVSRAAGEGPQSQEGADLGGPVGVGVGAPLVPLELLVVDEDRLGHPTAGDVRLLQEVLVVHVAHDRVPRQDDVARTHHALLQEVAQGVPVLHVRQRPQGVAVLQEVGRVLCLPGLAQLGGDVVDGVPLQAHRLGHLARDLDLPGSGTPIGEGHRPVQGAVKRQPRHQQPRVQPARQGQYESRRARPVRQVLQDPAHAGVERREQQVGELLGVGDHVGLLAEPRQGVVDRADPAGGAVDAHDRALLGLVDADQQRVGAGDETGVQKLPAGSRIQPGGAQCPAHGGGVIADDKPPAAVGPVLKGPEQGPGAQPVLS